jgi:endonuclease III
LVSDERRLATWERFKSEVGSDPQAILAASEEVLTRALAGGGMLPNHRAAKILRCAQIAIERFGGETDLLVSLPTKDQRKELKRFPSIGSQARTRFSS